MKSLTRRQFAAISIGSVTGLWALFTLRRAWAQQVDLAKVATLLQADRDLSSTTYKSIRESLPVSQEQAQTYSSLSFETRVSRAELLQQVAGLFDPFEVNAKAPELLAPETAYLIDHMRQAGISPFPEPLDITRDPFVPLPPLEPLPVEEKWRVVLDIVLDALGLLPIKEIALEVLVQVEGYSVQEALVRDAFEKGDPERIRDAIFGFMEWLLEKALEPFLVKLAERKVAKVLLRSLIVRLVPFVGWGWLLVAFALSVNRHWDRLTK